MKAAFHHILFVVLFKIHLYQTELSQAQTTLMPYQCAAFGGRNNITASGQLDTIQLLLPYSTLVDIICDYAYELWFTLNASFTTQSSPLVLKSSSQPSVKTITISLACRSYLRKSNSLWDMLNWVVNPLRFGVPWSAPAYSSQTQVMLYSVRSHSRIAVVALSV